MSEDTPEYIINKQADPDQLKHPGTKTQDTCRIQTNLHRKSAETEDYGLDEDAPLHEYETDHLTTEDRMLMWITTSTLFFVAAVVVIAVAGFFAWLLGK